MKAIIRGPELDLWQVNAPPRFPIDPQKWSLSSPIHAVGDLVPVGAYSYDLIINPGARTNPLMLFVSLRSAFPWAFAEVGDTLSAHQWRFLYYACQGGLGLLAQPDFNPQQALRTLCLTESVAMAPPLEWLGTNEPLPDVIQGVRQSIENLTVDQCKAVWSIVAFVQALRLGIHEVLQLPWHDDQWLAAFIEHAEPGEKLI